MTISGAKTCHRVLVVGAQKKDLAALSHLAGPDYLLVRAENSETALRKTRQIDYDLLVLELTELGDNGLKILRSLRAAAPRTEVIVVSATDRAREAVAAIKCGAMDYIPRPFRRNELRCAMQRAINGNRPKATAASFGISTMGISGCAEIIGRSQPMRSVARMVRKVSSADSTVLVSGESGTGKELVARAIHAGGRRSRMPFVAVNCAAVPPGLMESELFGHEKGAFSGAYRKAPGIIAHADGGTVFLDEIASMDPSLQAKLLRFLQDRQVMPVGGVRSKPVDVRIIAACNIGLEKLVSQGGFRRDLFFRLNVLPIELPPLRTRGEDVDLLAVYFLKRVADRLGRRTAGFTPDALKMLSSYDWPGNVRELENLVERMVVLCADGGPIGVKDLPAELLSVIRAPKRGVPPANDGLLTTCRAFERQMILQALEGANWNRSLTARRLQIHRNTLAQKMQRLEITRPYGDRR